jgi:citrate synthase
MTQTQGPVTRLCTHTLDALYVRDRNLVEDLMGKLTFTEMMFLHITGRMPGAAETAITDAVLVTLMEHGLTPSVIATRLVYHSAPEALQGAVASGLLAVGSQFVGTMELAAGILQRITTDPDGVEAAAEREVRAVRDARRPMPGFGHHMHKPDDPRTPKLFEIARAHGVPGTHIAAIETLGRAVDAAYGKHITINATGAVAAVLMEIGIEPEIMRGFAVISRAAGLVGHIAEERAVPSARTIWDTVEKAVPYAGEKGRN